MSLTWHLPFHGPQASPLVPALFDPHHLHNTRSHTVKGHCIFNTHLSHYSGLVPELIFILDFCRCGAFSVWAQIGTINDLDLWPWLGNGYTLATHMTRITFLLINGFLRFFFQKSRISNTFVGPAVTYPTLQHCQSLGNNKTIVIN